MDGDDLEDGKESPGETEIGRSSMGNKKDLVIRRELQKNADFFFKP